jgi:hypothetical protein
MLVLSTRLEVPFRAPQQEQARWRLTRLQGVGESRSEASILGATGHTSSTEHRARTTAIASLTSAQNGTSGVLAGGKHN